MHPDMSESVSSLALRDLIWSQLQGKSSAVARYDSILWKIRAGYIAVLYSALSLFFGLLGDRSLSAAAFTALCVLVLGFSGGALAIDLSFLKRKLRVVEARNDLSDLAFEMANGNDLTQQQSDKLKELLHFSGDKPFQVRWDKHDARRDPIMLYCATAIIAITSACLMLMFQ